MLTLALTLQLTLGLALDFCLALILTLALVLMTPRHKVIMSAGHLLSFLWVLSTGSPLISKVNIPRKAGFDLRHSSSVTPEFWHLDTGKRKLA
jgi:hypothetical protein